MSLNLFLLMYADDTVLFSENVDDLQKMINSVDICSNEYGLYIYLLKTKIVIHCSFEYIDLITLSSLPVMSHLASLNHNFK
jgi:hypothetical protein